MQASEYRVEYNPKNKPPEYLKKMSEWPVSDTAVATTNATPDATYTKATTRNTRVSERVRSGCTCIIHWNNKTMSDSVLHPGEKTSAQYTKREISTHR
jgi:hypothetical protein